MISMGRSNSSCGRGSSVSLKQFLPGWHRIPSALFPNDVISEPLSENSMIALLKRTGFGHISVFGFRSTFKDWASETTDLPRRPPGKMRLHTAYVTKPSSLQARKDA